MTHQAGERAVKAIARRLAMRAYGDGEEQYVSESAARNDFERTLREMGVGELLTQGCNAVDLIESAFAHVSHGGPTRADAEKQITLHRAALDKVLKAGG